MAALIVKDSGLNIFVKEVVAPANTLTNTFVIDGAKRGLAGFDAKQGIDTLWYTTVDTAAHIVFKAFSGAVTDGQTIYITSGLAPSTTASGNTAIGYADRAKLAASGDLHVQLVPASA